MDAISVISAEYVGGFTLRVTFSDGAVSIVDFESFLTNRPHPQYARYLQPELFKSFCGLSRKSMCLSIDLSDSEQEVFNI